MDWNRYLIDFEQFSSYADIFPKLTREKYPAELASRARRGAMIVSNIRSRIGQARGETQTRIKAMLLCLTPDDTPPDKRTYFDTLKKSFLGIG